MGKAKPLTDRIADIRTRREQLAAKEKALEAKARTEQRKNETRRKIVVGAAVLLQMEKDPMFARTVTRHLQTIVRRAQDRAVIADLLATPPAPAANGQNAPTSSPAAPAAIAEAS